ncbi:SH2 domain-containing adapter protein F-like isoform X1 [Carassius carassius]|uniref:SH2 domain-containing adapter protein F-like isoform X1 n=1 Tax=Carassius carassius TaxID=217509 RepID=UPI0028694DA0|nr:SH2 domain-containing adapter protein F-like isoform X1 [Carassius carassius]
MARWFKEHLGFKTTKAPPPAPPRPDYRHFHTAVPSLQPQPGTGLLSAQPDILTAYKLQKELDFEDPYTPGGTVPFCTGPSSAAEVKFVSPKHRLIKVETAVRAEPEDGTQEKLIILEDYADPFDAADQAGGTQTVTEKPTENDGYMEPYEAQKMMAEIRGGRAPKDGPVRQLPLYDTPYEPEENGADPDGCVCSRESRLPQDDERPPEEYDQPWEWKKDRISKAFAALLCYDCITREDSSSGASRRDVHISRSSSVEIKVIKDLPWPPPVGQLNSSPQLMEAPSSPGDQLQHVQFDGVEKDLKCGPLQQHSSGRMSSSEPSVGERIDPAVPLESQFWYHGAISRTDAEALLRLCKEASYLVRNSETCKNDFSLSLKSSQGFMHMKLSRTKDNKYVLGQNGCLFDSVPEIIHFYSSRKLPIKGAEHMSLLYPVAIRTL